MQTFLVIARLTDASPVASATYLVKTSGLAPGESLDGIGYRTLVADETLATDHVAQENGLSVTRLTPSHPLHRMLQPMLTRVNGMLKQYGAVRIDFSGGEATALPRFKQVMVA